MNALLPIKKLAVVFVAGGLVYLAQRLGVDLGADEVNDAAQYLVPLVFGYIVRDDRVSD